MSQFIRDTLKKHLIAHEPQVPELIFQYNQNNLLACNQIIEQLALIHEPAQPITCATAMDYLRDQGDFSIYELGDALLAGQAAHAIRMLRQMIQSQQEPTLVLWLLAQEIRKLIQLHHLSQQAIPFQAACQQLNIWAQKIENYQKAYQRLSLKALYGLLQQCQNIDEQLKSNRQSILWHTLEKVCLSLAAG
jgi:DNA polymerase III subunit delta